jgi:hypothetical protein
MSRRSSIVVTLALVGACSPTDSAVDQHVGAVCTDRGTFVAANLPARNPAYARVPVTGSRLAKNGYGLVPPVPAISSFATEIEKPAGMGWSTTYRRSMLGGLGIANYRNLTFGAALTPMATPLFPGPFANQFINPSSARRRPVRRAA